MSTPHKHTEVIRKFADGATIEYRTHSGMGWTTLAEPHFDREFEYRVKPETPAKVYPVTGLSDEDLAMVFHTSDGLTTIEGLHHVANAALRHAIDANQVITMDEHHDAIQTLGQAMKGVEIVRHAARDMAIAEAVRDACLNARYTIPGPDSVDLRGVIAGVK